MGRDCSLPIVLGMTLHTQHNFVEFILEVRVLTELAPHDRGCHVTFVFFDTPVSHTI